MDLESFKQSLQKPERVYLIKAEQEYLCRSAFDHCRGMVDEAALTFDWSVFDLEQDSETEAVNAARTLPWMSKFRWVYIRSGESGGDGLKGYLESPSARTVLVIEVKKRVARWPRNLPLVEMGDSSNPHRWLASRANEEGFRMESGAAQALVELVGEDFQRLESELQKLFLLKLEEKKIDREAVLEMVLQTRESDIFELIGAVAGRRADEALKVLGRLFDSGTSPQQVVSMLYWNFRRLRVARELLDRGESFQAILRNLKIWSYRSRERDLRRTPYDRLESWMLLVRESDKQMKGSNLDERIILERLIIDTCR